MIRRTDKGSPVFVIAAWLLSSNTLAQNAATPEAVTPMAAGQPTVEWAIAPAGTTLPEGTVVEEGMVLPSGTVLPGGAVLPAPSAATRPAPITEQSPAPAEAPVSGTVAPPPGQPMADRALPAEPAPAEAESGVPYISGGIGVSGREEMEQVKSQYNLRLLFAESGSGAYLSGVRVQIRDSAGPTLLTTVTTGPWLYADLAPGNYTLTVEYAGQAQTRQVRIPASGAAAESFYWSNQ
jgi:hypothetical protein